MLNNTHHYDQFWAWQKKRHAATAMEKSERSSDQSWACFGFLSRRFGFRRSLGFRRSSTASETHAHAIQKPRSTIQQPKCAIQKRWDRRPLPHTYLHIFTLFTFILLSIIYKCFIHPYTKKSTVSCTRVNHYGVYGICVMHITLKTIHNYRQIYQMDYPWMMFFHVLIHPPPRVWGFILPTVHSARGPARSHGEGSRSGRSRVFLHPVRVFRFYMILSHSSASSSSTSASTSSHASSRSKWAQPDLNRELQISVGAAGPQPRAPDLSGHCRTSTASSRS